MEKKDRNIKIGVATEEQVNREFIEAWHKAKDRAVKTSEERLYFIDASMFFQVLSKRRIDLLRALHKHGASSIRQLSKLLNRDYKNVYRDVQLLKNAGLIHQDDLNKIYVPWDKIETEIAIAA